MQRNKKFPGRFESLEAISRFVKQAAEDAGLDEMQIYSVELAVDEACSNIIEHAYGAEGVGEIHCACIIEPDGLTIVIKDKGTPFNPDAVPDVNTTQPLEERRPGGAGVFLMRKVMDAVRYEFTADGNVLTMKKKK
ncbi:MAG TPA: ATP-binding protein [Anaerolineales bacterium]|nr:ATP-binding protein [Anaerolineales bacterium]